MTGNVSTTHLNENNPFRQGNMLPIEKEGQFKQLETTGTLPAELNGMFMRNGTNQRYAPSGDLFPLLCVCLRGEMLHSTLAW